MPYFAPLMIKKMQKQTPQISAYFAYFALTLPTLHLLCLLCILHTPYILCFCWPETDYLQTIDMWWFFFRATYLRQLRSQVYYVAQDVYFSFLAFDCTIEIWKFTILFYELKALLSFSLFLSKNMTSAKLCQTSQINF